MKKLIDSLLITKLLINETFNNILSHAIFNKKRNRYLFFTILIIVYLLYYFFNMMELQSITTKEEISVSLQSNLFSSLTNMIIIITGAIFLIVSLTFSLTNRMNFLLRSLPFERGSVRLGGIILQFVVSYGLFLVVFAIIIPLLKLFYLPVAMSMYIFLYCQILFLFSITGYYLIFNSISSRLGLNSYNLSYMVLGVFLFFYFFLFRFKIDLYFSEKIELDFTFILILTLSILVATIIFMIIIYKLDSEIENRSFVNKDFYFVPVPFKVNVFMVFLLSILRDKMFLSLSSIIFLFFILSFIDTKDSIVALSTMAYTYPIIFFVGIRYFNTTYLFRKMNTFYRIYPLKETLIILIISGLLCFPLILAIFYLPYEYIELIYYSFIIFLTSIIMGIIFPKNKSTVNEFTAYILCGLLAMGLSFISNDFIVFAIIFSILSLIQYLLLERSYIDEAI